jgi:RND family efflux transporter MFP subunit
VSLPITRQVTDYEDFPGRTDAVYFIQVRAHITGYVDKVNFKEGDDVREGDVLFEIDPRPYEAELKRAEANLVQAEAHRDRLNSDYKRAVGLRPGGAMGQEEFDKVRGDRAEAIAAVGVAEASREMARVNLDYTKVRAKISGRVSSRFVDPGNLVKADDTILTTLVSFDPMYAYFDVDEHNTLRLQRLIREGKLNWTKTSKVPVLLGLANEEGFPHRGTIDFADNSMDPDTGTWRLRGRFANADRMLLRGLYVRIRLPIGDPYQALLIAEQALGTDQGQKFVYVVKDKLDPKTKSAVVNPEAKKPVEEVEYRRVKVGRMHDCLRVITEGLVPGEKVIVHGLQRVRPGTEVKAEIVDMPVMADGKSQESGVRGQESRVRSQGSGGRGQKNMGQRERPRPRRSLPDS